MLRRLLNRILCVCLLVPGFMLAACSADQPGEKADTGKDIAGIGAFTDSVVIELVGQDSVNVFELLRCDHEVEYTSSLLGVFIKAIDSVETSSDAFWVYYVNDTLIDVAADKRLTRTGDRVTWHFRKTR